MSKKFKSQASSGRAAFGGGVGGGGGGGFGGFGTSSFATYSSPLSYVAEPPDVSAISNANIGVAFKNLTKKDSTTKAKALEDLQTFVSSPSEEIEEAVLEAWVKLYPRLSIDNSRRVRQLAHNVQGNIASKCGKRIVKHMPRLAGAWLAGAQDSDRAASRAAQDALKQVFPTPEKLQNVGKAFQQPILEYCRDGILNESVQTLSDERTVSPDDADATYARVIATSLAVIANLLSELAQEETTKQQETYDSILGEGRIWEFASYKEVTVRRAAHRLLRTCLAKKRDSLERNLDKISTAFIAKALHSDQTGSTYDFMQALVELTTEFPTVWTTSYSAKKPASQRLRQCMKRGSQAGPTEFWTLAWTLFSKLPVDILPKDYTEARDLLAALHDGLSQKEERFNASPAWTTYFKVADLIQEGEVGSRLSDGEHDKLTTEMVLPVVQQYLRPAQETVQWSILGAKASWNVSKTAYCRRLPPLLAKKWPEYATALAEEMKTSLPEQSKDFDKSQMAVAAAGERWALLQKEFLQGEYDIPESLRQAFAEANKTLVRESLQLLRNRNGKPYGAAAVVDELLNHCNEQVLGDQDTNNSITSFIKEDFSGMLNSPSQRQLLSLLYHFHNDSSFSEIWNKTASALANSPDSQEKTNAFRVLLSAPRVNPAAELALKNPDVQRYIQRQYESSISTNADWSFLAGVLKPYPTVASTDTTDAILANLTESLSISDKAALALEGLDEISKSNRALVKEFVTKPNGTQLLPGLLLLEESTDEAVAGKASNVSKRLMEGADQSSSQSALLGVVQQSLKEVSAKTLPMHAVLDMVARLLGQGDVPAEGRQELAGQLMPDVDVWRTALEPFWSKAPPPSLAVTNQLGGAVYLVKAQDASTKAPVARDAEGLSQALRLAVYSSRVFNQTALFEALDGECRREIFRLLYLTTLLANDNISVAGANNLWAAYNPDVEAEMVDFTSEAQRFIIHCMHHPTIGQADSPYAFVSDIIGNFRKEFGGFSPADFYGARMCCMAVGELVELHGHSANDMERWEGFLREARKERALLRLSACIAALRQPLWNNGQFNRYCNELVADLTGVNIGSKPEKALEDLVMLNTVLQSHKDAITVIAKQRVIFLVKHMLPWLEDEGVSTATKSEVFKSLSVLLPAMADIYGEHWVQVLSHIANAWSAGYVQADAPEVDDTRLPLVHASLKLYGALRSLKSSEDPNDDLVDAWKESQEAATSGLLGLLRQSQGVADELHQPLKITHELLAREIGKLPDPHVEDAGSLYPLLYTPAQAIQRTAFELLHRVIPAAQEQISFDAALENKTATLPEELLSLILEAPTADALADANFDSAVPLDLHGYLFSWLLVFDHFASSSYKVKSDYIDNLKEGTYLQGLLDFAFDFLGHVRGRPVDVSRFDIASYTPEMEASPERDVQWLLTHLYYLALTHLPSLTKSYYLSLTSRQTSLAVESWTAKFISPLIVSSSLGSVADWASSSAKDDPDYENFTVKVAMRSKEVNVSYVVDEQTMAIVVRLPETYPLEMARVEGVSRVAVDEKKWQSWLRGCQGVITFSNGNLIDGLSAWRKNVTGALKGQTECAICYSIISGDKQLPSKRCSTCKNLFHSSCLYKWFKTSNASSCPLCRNAFNYG